MLDWLAAWGVTSTVGFVFKPILEDLAKDATKDWAKDFFKDCLKNVVWIPKKEPLEIAAGKALTEFLKLVQQELEDADFSETELQQYTKPFKQFINNNFVKELLGSAFKYDCQLLKTETLAKTWNNLNLKILPDEFNWEQVAKRYLKKVKAIIRESDELRSLLDSQNLESARESLKEITGITADFNLSRYQESIRQQYGYLKLESLDTSGYAYNKLKLWRMFVAQNVRELHQVLPQIHEIPKEYQKQLSESNQLETEIYKQERERYTKVYYQQPTRSVLQLVNNSQEYKYLVVLGDPGSGKSTLLQYVALEWAELPVKELVLRSIPLLIELRTYIRNLDDQQCKNFLEFIHQSSGTIYHLNQHQLHQRLKAGSAFVMFDGLDEVFDPGKREDVITDIIRFTNEYPQARAIVTSRVIGYKPQRLRDTEFRHFMLQDLDSEQIRDFISRWHDLTFNNEADKIRKGDRLQRAIDTSSAIRELAGNPLLLTMMAILNRNQELPRDRPELYNQASRVLLHQWDVERALVEDHRLDHKTIDYKDKQVMLRQVAYHMQANENGLAGNLISASDLEKILTAYLKTIEVSDARAVARLMINQLRTRNFILCYMGADYYAFVHRTFLEYFCAWEFVWQFEKERKISLDYLKTEVFGKHWQDESWHEVLRLIAGMLEPKFVGEIIDYVIEENGTLEKFANLFLAFDCLSELRNPTENTSLYNKLLISLKNILNFFNHEEYLVSNQSKQSQIDSDEYILIYETCTKAVSLIATFWREHPGTFCWLRTIIEYDKREDVRREAVQHLAWGWEESSETLSIIKNCIRNDKHGFVRSEALEALVHLWQDDPETLPILKACAKSDKSSTVRQSAVQALAHIWKDDPETLPILRACIQSDPDTSNRFMAVQELVRSWKNDPDTLPILKKLAQSADNPSVRWIAIYMICESWQDTPDIFELLCGCATNDSCERDRDKDKRVGSNPRYLALEVIIEQYSDYSQTLPLLRDLAENDPDKKIREFVSKKLKNWFDSSTQG